MRHTLCILLCLLLLVGCTAVPVPSDSTTSTEAGLSPPSVSETLKIAVIDTGFSPKAISGENIAPGANYLNPEESTEDTYGHGTAVASVILSVSPQALLVPLVSGAYHRGSLTHVTADVLAQMIRDAIDVYGCRIINISQGLAADESSLREAVAYAEQNGALVVASAGNDYKEFPANVYYPAAYPSVFSVGALNAEQSALADFTQRGDWVDLYAPGSSVSVLTLNGRERVESGTSYAAAYICGVAVQLWRDNSSLSVEELRHEILVRAQLLPTGHSAYTSSGK